MGEALSTIEAESATMARVINAMLTLAKTDNPEALSLESVDLCGVVLGRPGAGTTFTVELPLEASWGPSPPAS